MRKGKKSHKAQLEGSRRCLLLKSKAWTRLAKRGKWQQQPPWKSAYDLRFILVDIWRLSTASAPSFSGQAGQKSRTPRVLALGEADTPQGPARMWRAVSPSQHFSRWDPWSRSSPAAPRSCHPQSSGHAPGCLGLSLCPKCIQRSSSDISPTMPNTLSVSFLLQPRVFNHEII